MVHGDAHGPRKASKLLAMQPASSATLTSPSPCSPPAVATTAIATTAAQTTTLELAVLQSHPLRSSSFPILAYAFLFAPPRAAAPLPKPRTIALRVRAYADSSELSSVARIAPRTSTRTTTSHGSARGETRARKEVPLAPTAVDAEVADEAPAHLDQHRAADANRGGNRPLIPSPFVRGGRVARAPDRRAPRASGGR